jgi:DUF4097 and DUF4098 domain-containing protein YvlB
MPKLIPSVAASCILAAFTATASAKIDRVVEKSFQVQPGVNLRVVTSGGWIQVVSSPDSVVKVTAKERITASSEAEADVVLQKLDLSIEQHGNGIEATASYKDGSFMHFGTWPPIEVDFIVTVPASTSVDLKTSGGDIEVGDLDGSVLVRTSGGGIKLGTIGGEIDAQTSGGNVELAEARAKVSLSTSGGDISAKRLDGPADLKTSGGDIQVGIAEGTLAAATSGGSVKAQLKGPLKGDCTLSTSGGEVKVTVDPSASFHLDASTGGGDVDAAGLTITIARGGMGKSSLSGDVNGGGPSLTLRSSGGSIKIAAHKVDS